MMYAEALDAYGAYLNALPRARLHYEPDALEEFEADLQKAREAMERAWLEDTYRKERA